MFSGKVSPARTIARCRMENGLPVAMAAGKREVVILGETDVKTQNGIARTVGTGGTFTDHGGDSGMSSRGAPMRLVGQQRDERD